MKGVSGAIILLLIILAAVGYAFYSGMISVPNSGGGGITYSNDVISLNNKVISVVQPISGTTTSIQFTIQNNGDKTVNNVDLSFYNLAGFSGINLNCGTGATQISNTECKFDYINSTYSKKVTVILTASNVSSPTPVQIYYEISYPYSGMRQAIVPVLGNDVSNLPSGIGFQEPDGTIGPIQATIQPPVGATTQQNGQTVVENFAREGIPFSISFSIQDTNPSNNLILQQQKILATGGATIDGCDKIDNTGKLFADEQLPLTVQCSLTPTITNIPLYDFVNLTVSYNYTYTLQYTDSFTILPKQ